MQEMQELDKDDSLWKYVKVLLETTAEHVTKYFGKGIRKGPFRTQFKSRTEIETEPIANVVGRSVIKGPSKLQFKSHPEIDTEPLTDIIGKSVIKESIKTQLKSHPEIYAEHLAGATGIGKITGDIKFQPKGYPGVNLLRNRGVLTQEDSFIKPIAPMKLTKSALDHKVQNVDKSNIDDLEESKSGTSLFKYKNSSVEYRDSIFSRRITPSKFPMNVINLSPFVNQVQSGNVKVKQKTVGFTNVLPAMISVSKKPISKALHTTRRKSSAYPHFKE
ncbi:coiled-coil domain-containing protein 7-like [Ochotona curzoniae]|uniref:coiled-coil domain-containing protein 7-like n=1 Tax=Ochotona curzoniae TaxID=130825 RepID=UPI001B34B192|nr:coiled-coil domain-containing protein 7-like [Ochotona curzoniae]